MKHHIPSHTSIENFFFFNLKAKSDVSIFCPVIQFNCVRERTLKRPIKRKALLSMIRGKQKPFRYRNKNIVAMRWFAESVDIEFQSR